MGSDESHFNVSVGSDGQSHKTVSTNHNHFEEKEGRSGIEPRSFRLPAYRLTARPNRLAKKKNQKNQTLDAFAYILVAGRNRILLKVAVLI